MTDYKRPNSDNYFEIQAELGLPFLGKELDTELTDAKNQRIALKQAIDATAAGNIPGSGDPINENKVLKTNGLGQVSWVFAGENEIADGGVVTAKYRDQSITNDKYQDVSISTAKYQDLSVTTEKINHNAVTTAKIADGNISFDKLGGNVVLETMKAIYPVGSVYICFTNIYPPFHNTGITWTLIAEGQSVMTANGGNTGTASGILRLDSATTGGTALTVNQIPSHNHDAQVNGFWGVDNASSANGRVWMSGNPNASRQKTSSTGGGQAHTHPLDIKNIKLLFYRRTA